MVTNKLISFFLPLLLFVGVMPIKPSFAGDNPFIGEINYFAGNFAPRGWAFCDGQLLPIASYTALFSLLGTTYGGDGRTTFALPELRGRVVVHQGTGPGISPKTSGEKSGSETVIATTANLPPHNHNFNVTVDNPSSTTPTNRAIASGEIYSSEVSVGALQALHNSSISPTGGGNSMNKMQPSITARCIIALTGLYPSRS